MALPRLSSSRSEATLAHIRDSSRLDMPISPPPPRCINPRAQRQIWIYSCTSARAISGAAMRIHARYERAFARALAKYFDKIYSAAPEQYYRQIYRERARARPANFTASLAREHLSETFHGGVPRARGGKYAYPITLYSLSLSLLDISPLRLAVSSRFLSRARARQVRCACSIRMCVCCTIDLQ